MIGEIQSGSLVDLAIVIVLFGAFVVGAMQGAIRRILGIISIVFAFLVSANLRDPVGGYLAAQWQQYPAGYDHLLAFGILFCALTIGFSVLIQGFYKRTELSAAHPVIDDVVGGLLGLLEAFIVLTIVVIILGSYTLPDPFPGEIDQLRSAVPGHGSVPDRQRDTGQRGAADRSRIGGSAPRRPGLALPLSEPDTIEILPHFLGRRVPATPARARTVSRRRASCWAHDWSEATLPA